ncbi:MAG: hypothetical protein ABSH38_20420 [Verrucomicrobiota bacterium]|jgi:hypothetical protein
MLRVPGSLWLGVFLAGSVALLGQNSVVRQGGEFSILGSVPGDQVRPSLSLSSSAGVIVWQDNMVDKHGAGVGGALLNTGFGASRIFRVNKTATGDQIKPKVQLLANNDLICVWESAVAGTPDIYARLARGPKGGDAYGTNFYTIDLRLNSYTADQQTDPAVTALPDGSAIVSWQSYGQDGSMWGVYARRVLATGKTPAKEFLVNQYTAYNQRSPAVATLANGQYVIAWISEQERFLNSVDVYARIFTAAGVPVTDEIPVNSCTNICDSPAVAPLNDGGFTVVWAQKDSVVLTNSWDVWGRAFSAGGNPEVSDFRINTYLYGDQYRPQIAAGPSGSLVVWTSMGQDGSREGVFGRFLQGGTQVSGDELAVNTTTVSQQIHPAVAWNGVDHFLVVWSSFVGAAGFDLYGQAYVLSTLP